MKIHIHIERCVRRPPIAALGYAVCVLALGLFAVSAIADIAGRFRAIGDSAAVLERLEQRMSPQSTDLGWSGDFVPPGSPFLEGPTVTVASAALLERLTSAVARAGGDVLSFEVEPQSQPVRSKDAYVKVIATCELEESRLQQLLLDIEAGMPFLFVDQLVAQAPAAAGDGGRLRLVLTVSGLWTGAGP